MQRNLRNFLDDTIENLSVFGSYQFFVVITLFFLFSQNYANALFLFLGLAIINAIVIPIRLLFFKKRPNERKYSNLIEKAQAGSMPSMHASLVSFLFQSLVFYFEADYFITIFLVLLTITVLFSRVHLKAHDAYDVIAGFFLGFIVFISMVSIQLLFL